MGKTGIGDLMQIKKSVAAAQARQHHLIYLNAVPGFAPHHRPMWQPITTAPTDRDIELAVLDGDGPHALVFPCRRIASGWMNAQSGERLDVRPTHWRDWTGDAARSA